MMTKPKPPVDPVNSVERIDPGDLRLESGEAWERICEALRQAGSRVLGEGAPDTHRDRAEGFRYLTRFLEAGIRSCMSHDDPDHPIFGRMIEYTMPWGLDAPDCLYLYAALRSDATYRVHGSRGTANHIDIQVNFGHFSSGDIGAWGTIASLDGFDLAVAADGCFELLLGGEPRTGNWLPLSRDDKNAEFLLVRQYFADWERERPAALRIERIGETLPIPAPSSEFVADRLEKLQSWIEKGGALWETMSRGLLGMEPNSLVVHLPATSAERAGMRGQAYGMGNFHCPEGEAVLIEFEPPPCHHWSVSLANYWWETLEYASRQTSLNGHQATLDDDGVFRAVISDRDPGVANWLDTSGHERGSLAARFLRAERAPSPRMRRVPFEALAEALPTGTPRITPHERARRLARRREAVLARYPC
jgi:hypothetical protein